MPLWERKDSDLRHERGTEGTVGSGGSAATARQQQTPGPYCDQNTGKAPKTLKMYSDGPGLKRLDPLYSSRIVEDSLK